MTAAAIAEIFGDPDKTESSPETTEPSRAERRQAQAEAKDAERRARLEAKAEAKAARAEEKAAARAARDEERAAARTARQEEKAAARAAKLEERASASEDAPEVTTEPEVDENVDPAERPIAVAAKLQQDKEDAEQREREAREAKENAAQARREAAEARKAQKAEADIERRRQREEAATVKAKADAERQKEREEAAAAKAAAKRERDEAAAAKAATKHERDEAKAMAVPSRPTEDDHIVEAPREPKKSLLERIRPAKDESSEDSEEAGSNLLPTLAVIVGALGFVFSVILAIGAFMVALNPQDDGGLFNAVSNVCDALVGPLRGVFSFSGTNGESKDALVAWGLGALGYLVIGLFAQSLLRAKSEDDS